MESPSPRLKQGERQGAASRSGQSRVRPAASSWPCALQLGAKSIPFLLGNSNGDGEIIKRLKGWRGEVNMCYYKTLFSGKEKR